MSRYSERVEKISDLQDRIAMYWPACRAYYYHDQEGTVRSLHDKNMKYVVIDDSCVGFYMHGIPYLAHTANTTMADVKKVRERLIDMLEVA